MIVQQGTQKLSGVWLPQQEFPMEKNQVRSGTESISTVSDRMCWINIRKKEHISILSIYWNDTIIWKGININMQRIKDLEKKNEYRLG